MRTFLLPLVSSVLFTALLFSTSCKVPDPTSSIDDAIAVLDAGIEKITLQSQNWQTTLNEVLDGLPDDMAIAKDQTTQLLDESIGAASSNIICVVDAIPTRAVRGLERIKAELLNNPLPAIIPTVCQTSLSVIDLNLPEINRRKIILNGYDFDSGNLLSLELRRSDGSSLPLSNRLSKQSNYQYTVNIASMDPTLETYDKLVVMFEDQLLSEFSILPKITPQPIISTIGFIPASLSQLCPSHVSGDREFGGNGPDVQAEAELIIVNDKEVHVRVYFNAKETKSDWTEAEGEWTFKIFPTSSNPAPSSTYRIRRILSSTMSSASYRDNDHSVDVPSVSGGLVSRFECVGDTGGDDVGNCNGNDDANLSVFFNQVRIEIED